MTFYHQQKIIKKAGKIGEILNFTFSTALPEGSALLLLVLQGIFAGDSENQTKNYEV